MHRKIYILGFILLLVFNHLSAKEKKHDFAQHLTIEDNLSHNGVTSILEDSKGYLWIATYNGLNRYNGYGFEIFKNTLDKKLFPSNRIRTISEDENGNLWIGTDDGVSIFDYNQERFITIHSHKAIGKSINGPIVRKILVNRNTDNIVCISEDEGILLFDKKYNLIQQFVPPNEFASTSIKFFDGVFLDDSMCIFITSVGCLYFDISTEKYGWVLKKNYNTHNTITLTGENKFLLTHLKGLDIIEFEKNVGTYSFKLNSNEFSQYQLGKASIDEAGNLWLGAFMEGIIRIDNVAAFINGRSYKKDIYYEKNEILRTSCIYTSSRSGCWVGTFNKGIYRFKLNENPFKSNNANLANSLTDNANNVSHISAIDAHRVYISALRGGMVLLNTQSDKFETVPFNISKNDAGKVRTIYVDSEQNLWLQISNSFKWYRVRKGSKELEYIDISGFIDSSTGHARSITEDSEGNIWLGCINGVYKVSLNKAGDVEKVESLNRNSFFKKKKLSLVRFIYIDPIYDYVWLGSDTDGLLRVSSKGLLEDVQIDRYMHEEDNEMTISSNFVTSVVRLPNGDLWIGTEDGGICKVNYSDAEPEFIAFTEKDGLSNNVVKGILYDNHDNLWISTNIGLNKFNTKNLTFRLFRKEDGLPFEDFLYPSEKLPNGQLLFAGINDFCYFSPENILSQELVPRLDFSNLTIHHKSIAPGDTLNGRIVLNQQISNLDRINLKYNENVFSVDLVSLHFETTDNHFIKYQLSPVNNDWVKIPSYERTVNFNGLPPGEYELRVMASNALNQWTEPKNLKIIIEPPFWKTTPAYFLYILLISLIVYAIMHYMFRMNKLKYNLEIEQMEKENVKAVNAAKFRFFSNISHEIKTPITLISGPVNIMIERYKANTELNEKLQIVQRQSKKILRLVDQVHDFQKADANKLKMDYSVFSFDDFIRELVSDFEFMAQNDKKSLEVQGGNTSTYVSADKDKLEKIINNLLSNAFKYTSSGDLIKVMYKQIENELQISVVDTGKGIADSDLPFIFDRFYQSEDKRGKYTGGSGIGLAFSKLLVEMHYGYINAESKLDEGTTIHIKLPIVTIERDDSFYKKEQDILSVEKGYNSNSSVTKKSDEEKIRVDGSFSKSLIFFADDNIEMRAYVSGVLSNFFQIKAFANGKECLNALEVEWPDIIISDVLMPELNGFDLCERIKSDLKTSHIPIILLTACTTIEEQLKGLEVGADAYIKKPFELQHLVTRIETLLQNRKRLSERFQGNLPLTFKKDETNKNDISFLEKLYSLMEENLDNTELDIDLLAKRMYLNRTHFYQKVKALTNQTPFDLLKSYRLKRSGELLVEERLSIGEVYSMTGFKSRAHFSRSFKNQFNQAPGEFVAEELKKFSGSNKPNSK